MKIQSIASLISISVALALASPALANDRANASWTDGFYGGVSIRDGAPGGMGVNFGVAASPANLYPTAAIDDSASRALAFGGYRWSNDLAVEASLSALDQYALRPFDPSGAQRGVGLRFGAGSGEVASRSTNLDLVTSWTVYRSVALYGRVGYAQVDGPQFAGSPPVSAAGSRGPRDGMNYGIGVRYDLGSSLGLRLEYSRFGRFVGEIGASLPETDQVKLGVQFRF
jgi:opacity protein-like surface antigen